MRKTMAKFLSVVCVIALAFSVCTFSVMAEESVLGALTAEKLAVSNGVNQVPTCIVNNLTLPEIDGVTWSSSNPAVLANDGTVTRPVAADANVTLTATAGEETKTFNFTVKAYTTAVHVQDSFVYASRDAFISANPQSTPWYTSDTTDTTSNIVTDTDGNQYAAFDFIENKAVKRKNMSVADNMVYMEFDVKADPTKIIDTAITVGGKNTTDGTSVSYSFYPIRFQNGTIRMVTQYTGAAYNFGSCNLDTFVHLGVRVDVPNKVFYVTGTNGTEYGPILMSKERYTGLDASLVDAENIVFDTVTRFEAKRASTNTPAGTFSLDNFVVYTKAGVDELLPTLPAEKQLAYVVSDLEEKFPLTDNAALTAAKTVALPTYGGLVSWTDANGNALGESVTLTQNQTTFNSGKLIATITPVGGEAKTYTYAYSVLPLETTVRTRTNNKAAYSFDGDWVASTIMNGGFNTNNTISLNVLGTTNAAVTEGVTWTSVFESETEVANKVGKLANATEEMQAVAIDVGGGTQVNTRLQAGASFKVTEGNQANIEVYGPGSNPIASASFDFEAGTLSAIDGSNDVVAGNTPFKWVTYDLASLGVTKDAWTRVEFDYNTVGFVYDVYVNGTKVNDVPLNFGCINGNGRYWSNTFRSFRATIPAGGEVLLDNVTIAETLTSATNVNAVVKGAMDRVVKNLSTEAVFANGETLYNDFKDKGAFPGTAYVDATDNSSNIPAITVDWKLDGVALPEVDGRDVLSFTGMGTHTLEATVTFNGVSATKTFEITGAPVALRVSDTLVPEVKLGSDISGKLIVAKYTDETMKTLDSVKIYNYTNGVNEKGEFSFTYGVENDTVEYNSRLFFISDNFAPIAFDVAR